MKLEEILEEARKHLDNAKRILEEE